MEEMLKAIKERKSSRELFDPEKAIPAQALEQILEAGSFAPTAHNMQNFEVIAVDDKAVLDSMSAIENPISATFIRENYRQLSFSKEELKAKKVGILADRFPPAWSSPEAEKGELPESTAMPTLGRPVKNGPVMLLVLYDPLRRAPASEDDFLGIISLGCVMENMWLMANSLGIGLHVMSVLSNDPVEKKLKTLLGIPDQLKLAFSCRLGYPLKEEENYLRVRREVKDFAHHNSYGNKGIK